MPLKQLALSLEMKSNLKNILLGCLTASLFFDCSSSENERQLEKSCEVEKVVDNTPNEDSELALLMRKLYLDADSIKRLIENDKGTISNDFIAEIEKVHTAIPTDPTIKTPEFEAFNKLLISTARTVQENEIDKVSGFNSLVSRCIDCHQSFCPGPIVRIKKLEILTPVE